MNVSQSLRVRINFQGEFDALLTDVVTAYDLGDFISFSPIELGYEDLNLKLTTKKGNYFIKIFAEKRDNVECLRLINMVKISIENGVNHPEILRGKNGYIFRERYDDFNIRLAVFEFIDGKSFYELKRKPTKKELEEIVRIAALVNKIEYKPAFVYDSWAIINYSSELEKAKRYLPKNQIKTLEKLQSSMEKVDIKSLPHSLVHGDLISTNIMKAKDQIYFVDFSVANYSPRIVELAVLMCDMFFDPSGEMTVQQQYNDLITQYQKYIQLSKEELEVLPLFVKLAHAMHLVRGLREKGEGNTSDENNHWIEIGKNGLEQTLKMWK